MIVKGYKSPSSVQEDTVYFHPEQVRYLERIFPEVVHAPDAPESALRHYNGQRSVIKFIKSKTRP